MNMEENRSLQRESFRQQLNWIRQQIDSLNASVAPGYEEAVRILESEAMILVLVDLVIGEVRMGKDPTDHYRQVESALYIRAQLEWRRQRNRQPTVRRAFKAVVIWVDYLEVQHPAFHRLRPSLKIRLADYRPIAQAETEQWLRDARAFMTVPGVPDLASQEAGTVSDRSYREKWFKRQLATKGRSDWSDYRISGEFGIDPHVLQNYRDGTTKKPRPGTLQAIAKGFGITEADVPK